MSSPLSQSGSSSSGSPGIPTPTESPVYDEFEDLSTPDSDSPEPPENPVYDEFESYEDLSTPDTNSPEPIPENPLYGEVENYGFAMPSPGFNPEARGSEMFEMHGQDSNRLDPADMPEESADDEIRRQIAEVEAIKGPLPEEEKERTARKIQAFRDGSWLEGLKLQAAGKDSVPVESFNRVVEEYEGTIAKMAGMMADAERKMVERCPESETRRDEGEARAKIQSFLIESLQKSRETLELDKQFLQARMESLEERLHTCQRRNGALEDEVRELNDRIQDEGDDAALMECQSQVVDLQKQLLSTRKDLETARETASRHYNDVQEMHQLKIEANQREHQCKEEIGELRRENKDLHGTISLQSEMVSDLRHKIEKLKAEKEESKAETQSSTKDGKDPDEGTTVNGHTVLPEDVIKLVFKLRADVRSRDNTIIGLTEELDKERELSKPRDEPTGTNKELQARCVVLKDLSDTYRERWARNLVAGNANLVEFWKAVENTSGEIKQLYQGIERLSLLLGVGDGVIDTPGILDKIIAQVSDSVDCPKESPELTILSLRVSNTAAQAQIAALRQQLAIARMPKTQDELKIQLRIVEEEEVEKRVSSRTQSYRHYRRLLLERIFEVQAALLDLAQRSSDRGAIEDIVDRFLEPTSLPLMQLVPGGRDQRRD